MAWHAERAISALIAKLLGLSVALATAVAPYSTSSPMVSIEYWANLYGAPADEMYQTLQCESTLNPDAVGDQGRSFGIAQIFLPAHADISKQDALNPNWAINWMARQFARGTVGKE